MKLLEPYKFAGHKVPDISELQTSRVAILHNKAKNGEPLTREEKDWLFDEMRQNTFGKLGVALSGWIFPFGRMLNRYWVQYRGDGIREIYAFDATCIRTNPYTKNRIRKIVKVKKTDIED